MFIIPSITYERESAFEISYHATSLVRGHTYIVQAYGGGSWWEKDSWTATATYRYGSITVDNNISYQVRLYDSTISGVVVAAKTVPAYNVVTYWTWKVYYRGNSPSGGTVTGLPSNETGQEVSGTVYRYTIPSTTPELSDYIFTGWEDQNGNSWSSGSRFTIGEDDPTVYLYAQWLYPSGTVKVVFDEGIASISGASVNSAGTRRTFSSTTSPASFSNIHHVWVDTITLKSGYTYPWYASISGRYYSWSERTSGSTSSINNTIYPRNSSTATLTLSATLQPFNWYIYYRDRLGSGHSNWPQDQSGTSTASLVYVTLSDDYPTRTGYNFVEWENNSGATFNPGDSISISAEEQDVYLYAVWSAHTYTIYFNGNGSTSGTMSNMYNLEYGTSYTLNANVYKKQYNSNRNNFKL